MARKLDVTELEPETGPLRSLFEDLPEPTVSMALRLGHFRYRDEFGRFMAVGECCTHELMWNARMEWVAAPLTVGDYVKG